MTCVIESFHSLIHVAPHSIALRIRKRREGAMSLSGKKTATVNPNVEALDSLRRTKGEVLEDLLRLWH